MGRRLPNPHTVWLWGLDFTRARMLIEVIKVQFNGESWDAIFQTLPALTMEGGETFRVPMDKFWVHVTPVGGRIEDLSLPVDESQYIKERKC